jgi:transposase-like protein
MPGAAAKRLPTTKSVLEIARDVQSAIWTEISATILKGLKSLLEGVLEDQVTEAVGVGWYERSGKRLRYRNGHYTRDLATRHGLIEDLQVPRIDKGAVPFSVFSRYQRRQEAVDAAIGQLFLQGISTRKLKRIAKDLFGVPVSATTVSKAAAVLDEDLKRYQTQSVEDDVEFLFLDGITQKVREIGVEGKVMLCAFGIHADGKKEILSFRLADTEDTDSWEAFLIDLKGRGLQGKRLRLITVDGNPALLKALRRIYPARKIQRCIAHKLRNVVVKLKRSHREACMGEARLIFGAQNRKEAIARFREWRKKWIVLEERAVKCLEKDLFHCLHYFSFPKDLWKRIRTTNILERTFREIRRRTNPMGMFTNAESAERIMYGVSKNLNANWKENPLPQFQQNP